MNEFLNYDTLYPDLILDIIKYFDLGNKETEIMKKSVLGFCLKFGSDDRYVMKIDPQIVASICKKLSKHYILKTICTSASPKKAIYAFINNNNNDNKLEPGSEFYNYINSVVYGYRYIYRNYSDMVVPIVYENQDGDISIGTGFKFLNGIATAKHCIEGARSIGIRGYCGDELKNKVVYISENPYADVAFICINKKTNNYTYYTDPQIMDDIIVMGYPKIPGFTDFLTAEKATVSAMAESRITANVGEVTAIADNYLSKIKLMLITAKIRGGNSGGPVINSEGFVVGISCQVPAYEGNYDDLGYGVATPISELIFAINSMKTLDVSKIDFQDFF